MIDGLYTNKLGVILMGGYLCNIQHGQAWKGPLSIYFMTPFP